MTIEEFKTLAQSCGYSTICEYTLSQFDIDSAEAYVNQRLGINICCGTCDDSCTECAVVHYVHLKTEVAPNEDDTNIDKLMLDYLGIRGYSYDF